LVPDDDLQMKEGARVEELQVQRCHVRLDQLATGSAGDKHEWEDTLWMSYYDTATKLTETSGIQVIAWWASQENILLITRFMFLYVFSI
jgi:hypothetical protein